MRRGLVILGLATMLAGLLVACTNPMGGLKLEVTRVGQFDANGLLEITGKNFVQQENGAGMRVQACGVTLPAELVQPTRAEVLLPPAGLTAALVSTELRLQVPIEHLTGGVSDVRVIRPDGRSVMLESAAVCALPAVDEPATETVAVLNADVTSGKAPLVVNFSAAGSTGEGALAYAWDFGDGGSASAGAAQHTFTTVGDFTVTLTVTSESGTSSAEQVISVAGTPTARITVSSSDLGSGANLTIDAVNSSDPQGQALTYRWLTWGGSASNVRSDTTRSFGGSHPYLDMLYFQLTVTNEDGLSDMARSMYLGDPLETRGNPGLGPDQPDISHVQWSEVNGRVSVAITYFRPPNHLAPGTGLSCDPANVAAGTHVGFIALDIDQNASTGSTIDGDVVGIEYLIYLSQRDAEGRYPLVAAGAAYDPCRKVASGVLQWVDVSVEGDTVTFSFDELGNRAGDIQVAVREYAHNASGSDTVVATHWRVSPWAN